MNHLVFSVVANDNDDARSSIIFSIKDTNYMSLLSLSTTDNQKLSIILTKGFERSVYWNENSILYYKTARENKDTINEYRHFFESNFLRINSLFVLIYMNKADDVKRYNAKKYYLPKVIIEKL